jgi:hypothetical protein
MARLILVSIVQEQQRTAQVLAVENRLGALWHDGPNYWESLTTAARSVSDLLLSRLV